MEKLLYFDLDLTGTKIFDEVCSLAVLNPENNELFHHFIMPARDISFRAKNNLLLSIRSNKYIRELLDLRNQKVLSSRSLYWTLKSLLHWMETQSDTNQKFLIAYYSETEFPAMMLVNSIRRYKFYVKYNTDIVGIINMYDIFKNCVSKTLTKFNLKILSEILLDKEETDVDIMRSHQRVQLVSKIAKHLHTGSEYSEILQSLQKHSKTIAEINCLVDKEYDLLDKKRELDPLFRKLFSSPKTRGRFVKMRNDFVSENITYSMLIEKWNNKELSEYIKEKFNENKDVIDLIEEHFKMMTTLKEEANCAL